MAKVIGRMSLLKVRGEVWAIDFKQGESRVFCVFTKADVGESLRVCIVIACATQLP